MKKFRLELDNKMWEDTERKNVFLAWTVLCFSHQYLTLQALYTGRYWEVSGYSRRPGWPRTDWNSTGKKIYRRSSRSRQTRMAQQSGSLHPHGADWIRVRTRDPAYELMVVVVCCSCVWCLLWCRSHAGCQWMLAGTLQSMHNHVDIICIWTATSHTSKHSAYVLLLTLTMHTVTGV